MNKHPVPLVFLAFAALTAVIASCNTPQPLPVAPTAIPTLAPATLPPPGAPTAVPGAAAISFPTAPPDANAADATYQGKCAGCHGADGKGAVQGARDFTDVDYMRAAAPVGFYSSITNGKEQMPAFKDGLTDSDRWNTTYYLWHFAVPKAELDKGQQVFQANCVACHGADGKGTIPQAPNLTDPKFISSAAPDQLFKSVSGGKGIMPAWQDRLSSEDRWAAVEYARAFAYQPYGGK
jgi:cytochrome c oxidase cbb3-type subunit III